jgi:hypothetical protein
MLLGQVLTDRFISCCCNTFFFSIRELFQHSPEQRSAAVQQSGAFAYLNQLCEFICYTVTLGKSSTPVDCHHLQFPRPKVAAADASFYLFAPDQTHFAVTSARDLSRGRQRALRCRCITYSVALLCTAQNRTPESAAGNMQQLAMCPAMHARLNASTAAAAGKVQARCNTAQHSSSTVLFRS